MVWLSATERKPVMLMVRAVSPRRFELLRVSEEGAQLLQCFENGEDAIRRWNEMEDELRRLHARSDAGKSPEASQIAEVFRRFRR